MLNEDINIESKEEFLSLKSIEESLKYVLEDLEESNNNFLKTMKSIDEKILKLKKKI